MVKTQVATKALKKKSSFMIEDLLHTAHDEMPRTTDRSSREPVAKFYISTAGLYSAKDNPTQIIRHDVDTKSRAISPSEERPDKSLKAPSLSAEQERLLAKAFSLKPYLTKRGRQLLAAETSATEEQVKVWFRKRRLTQENQLASARQRSAKLAYLNSLARSLLNEPQPSPHQTHRKGPHRPVPLRVGCHIPQYARPLAVPSLYARHSNHGVRPSPYIIPRYNHPVNASPYYY